MLQDGRTMYYKLGGRLDLAEKRRRMLRFHYAEMELMEILAGWSETMIYIPLRVGVGQHIWDQARHCHAIAWALRNLKHLPGRVVTAQAPSDAFVRFCERLWRTQDPALRMVGLYKVLLPHVIAHQQSYIEVTDPLGDMFSIQTLQQCVATHTAQ